MSRKKKRKKGNRQNDDTSSRLPGTHNDIMKKGGNAPVSNWFMQLLGRLFQKHKKGDDIKAGGPDVKNLSQGTSNSPENNPGEVKVFGKSNVITSPGNKPEKDEPSNLNVPKEEKPSEGDIGHQGNEDHEKSPDDKPQEPQNDEIVKIINNKIIELIGSKEDYLSSLIKKELAKLGDTEIGTLAGKLQDALKLPEKVLSDKEIKELVNGILSEFVKSDAISKEISTRLQDYYKTVITPVSHQLQKSYDTLYTKYDNILTVYKSMVEKVDEIINLYKETDVSELRGKNNELTEKVSKFDTEIKNLKGTINQRQEEIEKANKEIAGLKEENNQLRNNNKDLSEQLNTRTSERDKANRELNDTKEDNEKKNETIAEQNKKIEEQGKDITNKAAEISSQKKTISSQAEKIETLNNDKAELEQTNKTMAENASQDKASVIDNIQTWLENIRASVNNGGFARPCANNADDCEQLEELLGMKLTRFGEVFGEEINQSADSLHKTMKRMSDIVLEELNNNHSWIYDIARYRAYVRKRFMRDESRGGGVYFDKEKIVEMWNNLEKFLSIFDITLILPDLYEDCVADGNQAIEDNTGETVSRLDYLVPGSSRYIPNAAPYGNDVIRDYADIGYTYKGKIKKITKIIR